MNPSATPQPGKPYAGLVLGKMLKHYTYDGLGRLVRTQSPFPTPASAQAGHVRSERFYYDGIRRIQETRHDPALSTGGAMASGDPGVEALGLLAYGEAQSTLTPDPEAELELDAATLGLESGLLELGGGLDPGPGGGGPPVSSPVVLVREYVWGPGDAWHPASVDELLVYYGEGREAYWPLHDSSGDIAAVAIPGEQSQTYAARVACQLQYDAYGQVLSADHIHPHAFLAAGHKGLFYDRLDRGVADQYAPGSVVPPSSATAETPRLVPFARGVYHVRNRSMLPGGGSPTNIGREALTCGNPPGCTVWILSQQGLSSGAAVHGRFMQADPNATAMVLMGDLAFHGKALSASVDLFALKSRFNDGPNLYQYLRSKPWLSSDPLGLELPSDDADLEDDYSWEDLYDDFSAVLGLFSPIPSPSDMVTGALRGLVEEYSARLEWDVEWASDWSMSDDSHSRLNGSWIPLAMARGVYEAFEIDLPFTERSVNPLDGFLASASSSSGQSSASAPVHHIMTDKNSKAGLRWTEKYQRLFDQHKIKGNPFNWNSNKVPLPGHKGPHSDAYHNRVYQEVKIALGRKTGEAAEEALDKKLQSLKKRITKQGAKAWGLDQPGRKKK